MPLGSWFHIVSDLLTTLAYFLFLIGLIYFLESRRDLVYRPLFLVLGVFLFLAGTTTMVQVWTYWRGFRGNEGIIKFLPALLAVFAAALFWRLIFTMLKLPALSDSKETLERLNHQIAIHQQNEEKLRKALEEQAADRKQTEAILQGSREEMERRVHERTEELEKACEALRAEIMARRLAEEPLQRSQENYQTLVNSIEGLVWEFDLRDSRYSFVSQQAARMLGYPVEAWLTEPAFWRDHVHGGDRDAAVAFRLRVAQDKAGDQLEYRMITSDGRTRWFRDMATAVVENGKAVKLRGVMVDITEQKIIEEFLDHERNFVSTVLDTASALVMILDPKGRIVRFNRACEEISGYSAHEARGKSFWDLFSLPAEASKAKTIFMRLLAGQFPINYESGWTAKDGSHRVIGWSDTVLFNKENVAVNVIATGIDITKSNEVEQKLKKTVERLAQSNAALDKSSRELQEANERLKKLDVIKSSFISAASHELRTPLTSVKGYIEAILQDEVGPLNDRQRQFLTYVTQSADRLHRLVNELLDISKIESGQVRMNKNPTDIKNLLQEEIMIFKPQAAAKALSLELKTDFESQEIYCDADKIREVMDNLISNAVKYTPQEGKIRIHAKVSDGSVRIDVHDTGIGIKEEDLPRIFEPFQNIEKNGAEGEESAGLGLMLAKKIVEAHEGEIRVKSQQGKGSTFTVILPIGTGATDLAKLHG